MPDSVETLGQFFTPAHVVRAMLALRRNSGRVLEPSCGDGAFLRALVERGEKPGTTLIALELDAQHAPVGSLQQDFFAYPESEKFATIIGNPPYVRFQNILPQTRSLLRSRLFDLRSNLYLFFIEKAIRHLQPGGELIFITPRDFLKNTSSLRLNYWLYERGTITHAIELGDARVFADAVPNCLIWRYQRHQQDGSLSSAQGQDRMQYAEISVRDDLAAALARPQWQQRYFIEAAGYLMFSPSAHALRLKDIASVKVGAVSGADAIYADAAIANRDFVCSSTVKTGKTRRMLWVGRDDPPPPALLPHKERLMARQIRSFDASNWWQWGRGYPENDAARIYVNGKTRLPQPFFLHPCPHFDGSVLAIFPHHPQLDLQEFCARLNAVAWAELGFVCDGRFLFSQRSLENVPLPDGFGRFLPAAVAG